jgi:hypothetical protein
LPDELEAVRPDVEAEMAEMARIYADAMEGMIPTETAAAAIAEIGARVQAALEEFNAAVEDHFSARVNTLLAQSSGPLQ